MGADPENFMLDKVMQKYLSRYAEQEVQQLAEFPAGQQFRHCVVIPVYREAPDFFMRLQMGPLHNQRALCVLVINQPLNDADTETNARLLESVRSAGKPVWQSGNLELLRYSGSSNQWLVVDRFSCEKGRDRRLPSRDGVGLARKIGCDLATALIVRSQIKSGWIHSTDADVFLPRDYFALPEAKGYSAALYDFTHQNDGSPVGRATALYEQALDYYVKGLAWAGSPYAFHTLGSALAVNARSYCQVRGFPRRSGGEDFYLLNKLAKVGPVYQAADIKLRIRARQSDRVPFGTGPTVAGILRQPDPARDYTYYNPLVFERLREWLEKIPQVWEQVQKKADPLAGLSAPVREALSAADWPSIEKHLEKQARNAEDATACLHRWFDGFQTLKFVHYLQAHYYPPRPLLDCLEEASFAVSPPRYPQQ